jgi:hypothetical protein
VVTPRRGIEPSSQHGGGFVWCPRRRQDNCDDRLSLQPINPGDHLVLGPSKTNSGISVKTIRERAIAFRLTKV